MNYKRDELAATIGPDGSIYAIGGYGGSDNKCLTKSEMFNITTGKWELLPEMLTPRRALAAVSLPDGVYAIGGYNGKNYLCSMERYDESLNKWVKCSPMNSARCTLSAVSSSDCQYIFAMGGFDG